MAEPRPHPFGHESSAIDVRWVLLVGAILEATVIVAAIAIKISMDYWIAPRHAQVVAHTAAIPPAPRLQPHPDDDLAALRAQKLAMLSSWTWTNSTHAFAHIPIERAMAIYAQQHTAATSSSPQNSTSTSP